MQRTAYASLPAGRGTAPLPLRKRAARPGQGGQHDGGRGSGWCPGPWAAQPRCRGPAPRGPGRSEPSSWPAIMPRPVTSTPRLRTSRAPSADEDAADRARQGNTTTRAGSGLPAPATATLMQPGHPQQAPPGDEVHQRGGDRGAVVHGGGAVHGLLETHQEARGQAAASPAAARQPQLGLRRALKRGRHRPGDGGDGEHAADDADAGDGLSSAPARCPAGPPAGR